MIFRYPEKLRGAALACANFGRCVTKEVDTPDVFSTAPERATLPVMVFDGDHDPQFEDYEKQNLSLVRLAQNHGYKEVSHRVVLGASHSPMPEQVLSYFYSQLGK